MMHALQYGEGLINLQELEGAACSPAILLCLAVVDVSLVLSVGIPFSSKLPGLTICMQGVMMDFQRTLLAFPMLDGSTPVL